MKIRLLSYCLVVCIASQAREPGYDHVFFINSRMDGNYFYSKATYQSPSWIKNVQQKLPVSNTTFFTPGNALQLQYINAKTGTWNAQILQNVMRGQDIINEGQWLCFSIYIASAGTMPEHLPALKLMNKDSGMSAPFVFTGYLPLAKRRQWNRVKIPLKAFTGFSYTLSTDITAIIFTQNNNDGAQHEIFVDDIEILPGYGKIATIALPAITTVPGYARHVDIEWKSITDPSVKWVKVYRSSDGRNYIPAGIQRPEIQRFTDYTGETGKTYQYKISFLNRNYDETGFSKVVSARTKSMTDEELLTMVQEACFRYYWEGAETNSGLAKENIPGRQYMIASGASGFGIMALIAGAERHFITRQQAVERLIRITDFLERTETFHGAFSHFINGQTKKAEPFFGMRDNGGDLVETSFLMQGLLAARGYFDKDEAKEKQVREKITKLWQSVEWDWYRKSPEKNFLTWHWSPNQGWIINHQLIGWNETMITYLLAMASPTHAVPAGMYYSGWANQDSTGQQYRANWGKTTEGSMYTNGNTYFGIPLDIGVSNGGPLFFTHYSYMGFDPHSINDKYTNYFKNNRNIALINYRYCIENPGKYIGYSDSCWGLTASDGPYNYSADEPVLREDKGKIAPTGAISSFPYTPAESMKALKNYYFNYGKFLWGEYGFRDAFNLTENWCSEIYMGLNQAPMVVMIENYRSGLLWKCFMENKDVQNALNKLREESKQK